MRDMVANGSGAMQIKDAMGNDHGRPKDIVGEVRQAFTSTADTAFDVCLENQLVGRSKFPHRHTSCRILHAHPRRHIN